MPDREHVEVTLDISLKNRLVALAQETSRDEGSLINEAIANFLDLQEWQRERIETAIAAADRGEFVTQGEVDQVMNKYKPQPQ